MEASHSQLTTGEQSGDFKKSQNESPVESSQPHSVPQYFAENEAVMQQPPQKKKQLTRKHLGLRRNTAQETDATEEENSRVTSGSSECVDVNIRQTDDVLSTAASAPTSCSVDVALEGTPRQKRESKSGKYVCSYCGRACAKPSVLQKHIRSHTGERPYPCAPCGFSFKTKSNLYKHRKSHTHKVKAGLTADRVGPKIICSEEPVTESDEERQPSSSSILEKQRMSIQKSNAPEKCSEKQYKGIEDSHAVKKRLAMRLSRGRQPSITLSDEASPSFDRSTSGSTESGYFSRSESTEVPQDSPSNTSAKSYAEVILGKFGRLDRTQRTAHQLQVHPTVQEGRRIPFTVPKKQVIDHITKLITINEAVVDTSKIDSVKPRRFSVSKKSSTESKPPSSFAHISKELNVSSKSRGSITLGVPCEKFQHHSVSIQDVSDSRSTAPLLKSHSMPSDTSRSDASETSHSLRLSQSFDDQQPVQNRRQGTLKRQSAIELPIGAEISLEDQSFSSSVLYPFPPNHIQKQEQFECEACGILYNDWERFQTHKRCCIVCPSPKTEKTLATHSGAFAFRKRRKEESLELEDTSLTSVPFITLKECTATCETSCEFSAKGTSEHVIDCASKSISVIQHTSSFEKHDNSLKTAGSDEVVYSSHSESKQLTIKPSFRKLVRQRNVQVPDILVTEDLNTNTMRVSSHSTFPKTKDEENFSEFQWPQRSPTLAQLPIEKLPPKKKRLRLAEAAQSSGDSSFESHSLPHSPSQDSCMSHTSSQSASFKESCNTDADITPTRRSRATHTLTVPSSSHREIRRSASEQAPHVLQRDNLITEARSKSFDYSCLSPDRTPAGWKEKQKCLLMRHATVRDPEEEHQSSKVFNTSSPTQTTSVSPTHSPGISHKTTDFHYVSSSNTVHPLDETKNIKSHHILSENVLHNTVQWTDQHTTVESLPSGAARAHYSQVSTGLKLEILMEENIGNSAANVNQPHLAHRRQNEPLDSNVILSSEQLRTSPVQRIPVRLNSTLTSHAISIYTTVSQTFDARHQEPGCSHDSSVKLVSKLDIPDQQPRFKVPKLGSDGAKKRVLSPTNSDELSPDESEPQQKQVKEEKNSKGDEQENKVLITCKTGERPCNENAIFPKENKEPSFITLNTNLTFSWCYLNYRKPNSSIQSDHQNSVYSSWCTSPHNPYPPGLTSKEMLSLLDCRQRHTSVIYTMAAMSSLLDMKQETSDSQQPVVTEVCATLTELKEAQQAELTGVEKKAVEVSDQISIFKCTLMVQICKEGYRSSEEYVYVRECGRRWYVCEECGICCKKPSMLHDHIPYDYTWILDLMSASIVTLPSRLKEIYLSPQNQRLMGRDVQRESLQVQFSVRQTKEVTGQNILLTQSRWRSIGRSR